MSLATRLSAFFLAVLTVVLLGFSIGIYGAARMYLAQQLDHRLNSALDLLEAAVDVEPEGLEWEPIDRRITLGSDPAADQVRWVVLDPAGAVLDASVNAQKSPAVDELSSQTFRHQAGDATAIAQNRGWRMGSRRLRLEELLRNGRLKDLPDDEEDDIEYAELTIVAALSPQPIAATLNRLALALVATATTLWLTSALAGRWLMQRALAPVNRMAAAARELDLRDGGWSLPEPGTGDELDELARSYNGLLARLHDAFARQSVFVGNASHQLRTPLTALLADADVTLRRERSADEYRRALASARDEAQRLAVIVESLLALARPAGSDSRETQPMVLNDWLVDELARWKSRPRGADVQLGAVDDDPLLVRARPELLAQLLDNLIDNGLKYSEPGSPVEIELRRRGEEACLSVVDHGAGMGPSDAERVFEPFYRSAAAREQGKPGVGLGLAVAQQIVANCGGTLSVVSSLGRGSTFEIRLPFVKTAAKPAPHPTRV